MAPAAPPPHAAPKRQAVRWALLSASAALWVAGMASGWPWAQWLGGGALLLTGLLLLRAPASSGTSSDADAAMRERVLETVALIDEATRLWSTHIGTVQSHMRDSMNEMLESFMAILAQLDEITVNGTQDAAADGQAGLPAQCEQDLQALVHKSQQMAQSRDEVLGTLRALEQVSSGLNDMAKEVGVLARETNLLSLNATIEAARA